jgi:hypothetical protein
MSVSMNKAENRACVGAGFKPAPTDPADVRAGLKPPRTFHKAIAEDLAGVEV